MKNILIGCPYTGMRFLEKELRSLPGVNCINTKDIVTMDLERIYTKNREYCFNDIYSAFIRYPYDLIPPHSGTYILRENTEYLKTIALLLSTRSVNPIQLTWAHRNRFLSLCLAAKIGLNVPDSVIIKKNSNCYSFYNKKRDVISKAIGNCFVADKDYRLTKAISKYFSLAEDGGETAIIYPAQKMKIKDLKRYMHTITPVFLQEEIVNIKKEFRVYLIGKKIFIFSRLNTLRKTDKSEELYTLDDFSVKNFGIKNKLFKLKDEIGLGYLCMDVIENKADKLFVVDINPMGSLPPYKNYPFVTRELARVIASFKSK